MKKHRNADESIYDRPVWIVKYKEVSNLLENTAKGRQRDSGQVSYILPDHQLSIFRQILQILFGYMHPIESGN
jgi:hypothetical protein